MSLSWLILLCHLQMIKEAKIMYRLTLHEELTPFGVEACT